MKSKRTNGPGGERAVSPVIGVILMVAITVILAAVIGTFVLNLGSNVQENVQAGASVTFDTNDDQVKVLWTSNQNADYLFVNVSGDATGNYQLGEVGATLTIKNGADSLDTSLTNTAINTDATVADGNQLTVTVTAISGDQRTVIVSKTDTL